MTEVERVLTINRHNSRCQPFTLEEERCSHARTVLNSNMLCIDSRDREIFRNLCSLVEGEERGAIKGSECSDKCNLIGRGSYWQFTPRLPPAADAAPESKYYCTWPSRCQSADGKGPWDASGFGMTHLDGCWWNSGFHTSGHSLWRSSHAR